MAETAQAVTRISTSPTKSELRSRMRKRRRALPPEVQAEHSQSFLNHVLTTRHYQNANSLACYMPVMGELDTRPLMHHALASGRAVYLPVIENSTMWFARWYGEDLPIDRASNLPQPLKRNTRLQNVRTLDLVIVPLVAFTRTLSRLGQGGGYYDRAFSYQRFQRWRRPQLIGAAHHIQESGQIPLDPWDVPLCGIITNRDIIFPR